MRATYILAACAALSACSADKPQDEAEFTFDTDVNSATLADASANLVAAEATPPPPMKRYAEKDGDSYLYVAAVSEEDQQKGRAAGDVIPYRYLGKMGSLYRLQSSDGGIDVCSRPCKVIKTYYPSGRVTRIGFSSSSIVGAAFEDAFNGFLQPIEKARSSPGEGEVTYSDLVERPTYTPPPVFKEEDPVPEPEIPNHVIADVDRV